jgi:threonine dehydrogenase-like Zn-dependent dehydrogenase
MGAVVNRSLTIKSGQRMCSATPSAAEADPERRIDPSFVITHRLTLSDAAQLQMFAKSRTSA